VDLPPGTADIQQLVFGLGKRTTFALLVVTPQLVAHRDAHRLLHELERGTAIILGGIENMAGQICPSCGDVTPLFSPAPAEEAIWTRIPKLASVPFSAAAAQDADRGKPVMITQNIPEQVTAYQLVARSISDALHSGIGRPDMN
jgi:ATP-binding protein involved in chromosome partitioning